MVVNTAAIIGIGSVGQAIAGSLLAAGVRVVVGARDAASKSVQEAVARHPALTVLPVADSIRDADVVFLCVPFPNAVETVTAAGAVLDGKVLIDCTNPIGAGLSHGLGNAEGGTELVQRSAPNALVVKAFSVIGFENMENPVFPGYGAAKPAMLIAGNSSDAKATVSELVGRLGWEPVDAGPASSSLHLEHITLLWIKMARLYGQGPNWVWGLLRR
jgi:predicted dinucleotide-binding enzyme